MIVLRIAIFMFAAMELSNVIIMYFKPDFKYGNSMRSFCAFEESKEDADKYLFVKYMTNWVANCKLIFIAILVVIGIIGSLEIMRWAVFATILSIGIFFISLYPLMKELDKNDKIQPKGYSKTLSIMIIAFMLMFTVALVLSFIV
ncbi:MAG: hypothetical protein R3Y32_08390 [Bacillota bacterium]